MKTTKKRQTTTLRLPENTHDEMGKQAKSLGMSLNAFICHLFEIYRREKIEGRKNVKKSEK